MDRRVGILLQEFAQEEVETKRAGNYEKAVKKLIDRPMGQSPPHSTIPMNSGFLNWKYTPCLFREIQVLERFPVHVFMN